MGPLVGDVLGETDYRLPLELVFLFEDTIRSVDVLFLLVIILLEFLNK
jgi:hypothetical protein